MPPFKELIVIDDTSNTPIYLQITNAFIQSICRGQLRRGVKLPSSRELSFALKIHRKTLQTAYDELMAQGWVEVFPRKGTFVVQDLPEVKPIKIAAVGKLSRYPEKTGFSIDKRNFILFPPSDPHDPTKLVLDDGLPDTRIAPTEILLREYRSLSKLAAFKKYFNYGDARGTAHLRTTLSDFLSDTRGLPINENNLMITRGAQMGIYLATKLLINRGDHVVVGEPGFFAAILTFQQAGATVEKAPVDDFGIDVDSIEALCRRRKIRLVYVIPHHHYPTTVTLIPERRLRLLELAARYKFAIIEDDYDYDFQYSSSPVLPMASLDNHGNVIYIGTLTKTLVPAMRIGFMVAAENFIQAVSHLRRSIDWQGDSMMEVAIAELYRNGTMGRHIKRSVKLYHERRDYFCSRIRDRIGKHISFKVPDGGMSVWAKFIGVDLKVISERASRKGLTMSDGTLYNTATRNYNATRLGFASLNLKEQDKAIEILKSSI